MPNAQHQLRRGAPSAAGGLLFGLAVTVLLSSLGILWLHRGEVPVAGRSLAAALARPVTQP